MYFDSTITTGVLRRYAHGCEPRRRRELLRGLWKVQLLHTGGAYSSLSKPMTVCVGPPALSHGLGMCAGRFAFQVSSQPQLSSGLWSPSSFVMRRRRVMTRNVGPVMPCTSDHKSRRCVGRGVRVFPEENRPQLGALVGQLRLSLSP